MPSNSLEQEAMDRVRRMYASFDNHAPQEKKDSRPRTSSIESEESPKKETKQDDPKTPLAQPNSLLDIFLKDQDQSLILLLLVMLMKDGADMNLMLALVYLLI